MKEKESPLSEDRKGNLLKKTRKTILISAGAAGLIGLAGFAGAVFTRAAEQNAYDRAPLERPSYNALMEVTNKMAGGSAKVTLFSTLICAGTELAYRTQQKISKRKKK